MKTDYYELLGVTVDATPTQLKKGFRKLALQLHPDKNPGEDAAVLFNEVRVAYETLMDPQERSWYDSHKYQVLAEDVDIGSSPDNEGTGYYDGTTVQDVEKYFNNDMFSRMDDSIQGFYQVANVLLTRLSSEEVASGKSQKLPGFDSFKDDSSYAGSCDPKDLMYPRFGQSHSDYGDQVRMFYKVWSGFHTVKTFSWVDQYRYSTAQDRRTRRMMEKENKKVREQARKEYNETVRKWISFLKRRDPRVNPLAQKKYEKERLRKQQQELKRQAQLESEMRKSRSAATSEKYVEQDWQQIDAQELAEIEQQLEDLYAEEEKLNGIAAADSLDSNLYECVVCNKSFKSEQQFKDHERSKKHVKKLKKMQWEMRQEGIELGLDNAFVDENGSDLDDEFDDAVEDLDEVEELVDEPEDDGESEEPMQEPKQESVDSVEPIEPLQSSEPLQPAVDDEIDEDVSQTEKSKLDELTAILNGTGLESDSDDDWSTGKKKKKGRKKRSETPSKASTPRQGTPSASTEEICAVCGTEFSSRNKLFQHVEETGHAAAPSKVKGKKKKKKKRR